MLGNLLGGLIDKEDIARKTITETLSEIAQELGCSYKEFFVMFKPTNDQFDFKLFIYKLEDSKPPQLVREMSLSEIFGDGTNEEE